MSIDDKPSSHVREYLVRLSGPLLQVEGREEDIRRHLSLLDLHLDTHPPSLPSAELEVIGPPRVFEPKTSWLQEALGVLFRMRIFSMRSDYLMRTAVEDAWDRMDEAMELLEDLVRAVPRDALTEALVRSQEAADTLSLESSALKQGPIHPAFIGRPQALWDFLALDDHHVQEMLDLDSFKQSPSAQALVDLLHLLGKSPSAKPTSSEGSTPDDCGEAAWPSSAYHLLEEARRTADAVCSTPEQELARHLARRWLQAADDPRDLEASARRLVIVFCDEYGEVFEIHPLQGRHVWSQEHGYPTAYGPACSLLERVALDVLCQDTAGSFVSDPDDRASARQLMVALPAAPSEEKMNALGSWLSDASPLHATFELMAL